MQTANLETTACVEPLKTAEQIINRIPSDADFVSLIEHLNSVIQQLSSVTEMEATLFIQAKVTVRFGLTKTQTNCIVKSIRDLRKKNHLTEARVPVAKKPVEFSSNLPYLVDVVNLDGKSAFLFKSPDGRVSIEDRIELEDRPILPPPIENLPYLLPRAECVMAEFERYSSGSVKELDEKLYDDLLVYLQESADLPNLESYHLLTTWVIHTYLMEYFHHSPILMLHGAPARGKSRLGRALINASFRGVHLVSLAAPHLIRLATDHSASLFFDVKDLGKRLRQEQTLDHFLLRGERGAITPRVTHPSKGAFLDMRFYTLFGQLSVQPTRYSMTARLSQGPCVCECRSPRKISVLPSLQKWLCP